MDYMPTLKDIAHELGLSVSTVSRALADNPHISAITRKRVCDKAAEMGYRPNAQARALRSRHSALLGMVIPDIENPYFSALASIVGRLARSAGYSIVLFSSLEDHATMLEVLDILYTQNVDGIVMVPQSGCEQEILEISHHIPIVFVDRYLPNTTIPYVVSDPLPGMTEALACFTPEPLCYLAGSADSSPTWARRACIEKQRPDAVSYEGNHTHTQGFHATLEALDAGITQFFAGDVMMGIGALRAFHTRRLLINHDVRFVGFDDTRVFALHNPPLTVVNQHIDTMCKEALRLLMRRIDGSPTPPHILIPTSLLRY